MSEQSLEVPSSDEVGAKSFTTSVYLENLEHNHVGALGPKFEDPPVTHFSNVGTLNNCLCGISTACFHIGKLKYNSLRDVDPRFGDLPTRSRNVSVSNGYSFCISIVCFRTDKLKYNKLRGIDHRFVDLPAARFRSIDIRNDCSFSHFYASCFICNVRYNNVEDIYFRFADNLVIHYRNADAHDNCLPDVSLTTDSDNVDVCFISVQCLLTSSNALIASDETELSNVVDIDGNSVLLVYGASRAASSLCHSNVSVSQTVCYFRCPSSLLVCGPFAAPPSLRHWRLCCRSVWLGCFCGSLVSFPGCCLLCSACCTPAACLLRFACRKPAACLLCSVCCTPAACLACSACLRPTCLRSACCVSASLPCFACSACFCPCFVCPYLCFVSLSSFDSLSSASESVGLCACPSVGLCACPSISLSACLSPCLCAFSVSLSVCLSVSLSVCQFLCLSESRSVLLKVCFPGVS